jgi:putative phosphoesterase
MRVAAIYDIHGNLPALEAVIDDIRRAGVDRVVVGGDVVPGPMPRETIDCLRDLGLPVDFIRGNGDREVLAAMTGTEASTLPEAFLEMIRWSAAQLGPEHARMIADWPATLRLGIGGLGDVLFCHATPGNDTEIFTRLTPEERLLPVFEGLDVTTVVCGHTHMQFDRMVGGVRVVNAGSVGMPMSGVPGADWLLLGPNLELRRTVYDLDAAADRVRGTSYPQASEFAERSILHPPSERETLETFSRPEPG